MIVIMMKTLLAVFLSCAWTSAANHPLSRKVEMVNESGQKLAFDWLNPTTGESVPFSAPTNNGERLTVDSFVNHTFVIRLMSDDGEQETCSDRECQEPAYVTVSSVPYQVVVIKEGLQLSHLESTALEPATSSKVASLIVSQCRQDAEEDLAIGKPSAIVMDSLVTCLEENTASVFEDRNEELAFQSDLRRKMSSVAENYTCALRSNGCELELAKIVLGTVLTRIQ